MTKITLELWGMTLMEPMALIMNWLLAAQALLYFKRLKSESAWGFVRLWKAHFLTFAISTLFGGLAHFLYFYIGKYGKAPGWTFALISITFLEMAISTKISPRWGRRLHYLIALKFITLLALMSFDFIFLWVTIQSATGILLVLGTISIWGLNRHKSYMKYFLFGIISLLASLPFLIWGIDLHDWFNRHDISHVFMMFALMFFYKGVRKSD